MADDKDDIFGEWNPFRDKLLTLQHFSLAAQILDRLENENDKYGDFWREQGIKRKERRAMLRRFKKHIGSADFRRIQGLRAQAAQMRFGMKLSGTMSAYLQNEKLHEERMAARKARRARRKAEGAE